MNSCFSKIALVIIRENKTKYLVDILKTESCHCYNHLVVIIARIAREKEVLDQTARAIFDNYQCNFSNVD